MVKNKLLDATDAEIETAVEQADPILLRGLLYQLTGDEEDRGNPAIDFGRWASAARCPPSSIPSMSPSCAEGGRFAQILSRCRRTECAARHRAAAPRHGACAGRTDPRGRTRHVDRADGARSDGAQLPVEAPARADRGAEARLPGRGHRRRHGRAQRRDAAQERRHPLCRDREESPASAAPGTRTAIPARGSTRRAAIISTPSPRIIPAPAPIARRPSTKAISTGSRTSSTCATTSSSTPRSSRWSGTRTPKIYDSHGRGPRRAEELAAPMR